MSETMTHKRFTGKNRKTKKIEYENNSLEDDETEFIDYLEKEKILKSRTKKKSAQPSMSAKSMFICKKKSNPTLDEDEIASGGNMKEIMSLLGKDFHKTVQAKRKKLEHYTDAAIAKHSERLENTCNKDQWKYQIKQLDTIQYDTSDALSQWEKDVKTNREQVAATKKVLNQQLKLTCQMIAQQKERVQSLHDIKTAFLQAVGAIEARQEEDTKTLNEKFCKDVEKMHKKISQENAQQALLTSAHKSLLNL